MTPLALIGAGALWLAFWHRVEGGARPLPLPAGTGKGRIYWSLAATLLMLAVAAYKFLVDHVLDVDLLLASAVLLPVAFIAALICIHKPWQRVGAPPSYGGSNNPLFVLMGSFFGALQVALMLAPLVYFNDNEWGLLWWAALGATQGPLYVAGRFLPYGGSFIDAPTAWGELFAGAAFGAALAGAALA